MQAWTGLRTSTGGSWQDLCIAETWIASNSTLIRHVVTGPEDPKVVSLRNTGDLVIAFDSKPPTNGDQSTCRSNHQGFADAVTQMYLSTEVDPARLGIPSSAYRLSYGKVDVAEKNWIPFVYQESVFFIYTPLPHVVLTSQNDGQSEKVFSTTFRPLQRVVQENSHV
ncbi:Fam3b, partial [Symbiodinium necroappetens]